MDLNLLASFMLYLSTPVTCLLALTPDNKEKELGLGDLAANVFILVSCVGIYVWSICYLLKQYGGPYYTDYVLIGFSLIFLVANCGFYFIRDALKSSKLPLSGKFGLILIVVILAMLVSMMPMAHAIHADVSLGAYIGSFVFYTLMDFATVILYVSYKTFIHLFDEKPIAHPIISLLAGFLIIVSIVFMLFCGYKSLECVAGKIVVGCELRLK